MIFNFHQEKKKRKRPMNTAAVIGVGAGKQVLRSSFLPIDVADKLISFPEQGTLQFTTSICRGMVLARKSSNFRIQSRSVKKVERLSLKAFREDVDGFSISPTDEAPNTSSAIMDKNYSLEPEVERSLEALILLQKSMLEKQWYLSLDPTKSSEFKPMNIRQRTEVVRSGNPSARQRRLAARRKSSTQKFIKAELMAQKGTKSSQGNMSVQIESLKNSMTDHMKGMLNQKLLTHEEVVCLSEKIQIGLALEKQKSRLKSKLGHEPSNVQWAASMNMSTTELNGKLIDSFVAAEKLTMCNIRLVISIARKYENMGVEMSDLIQEGLVGLTRGIKKFDSSKGFKLSTYVYWWIRQGITKAVAERSRIVRVPAHVHERLGLIRKAKLTLEANGMTPSLENIAKTLNMSKKKVENAQKGNKKIISFDKGYCGIENTGSDTLHSSIADTNIENQPWFIVERNALKEDVNKLISSALTKREQVIVRLYYGLDTSSRTYEDISKSIGLSRERVRQIGLVSMEKLRHATRHVKLEPIIMHPS